MNAEELKLITDAITTLGVAGKEAFIWFLVIKYGLTWVLHMVLWPVAAFTVYRVALLVASVGNEEYLRAIRKITHPNWYGFVDSSEAAAMVAEVARLKGLDK